MVQMKFKALMRSTVINTRAKFFLQRALSVIVLVVVVVEKFEFSLICTVLKLEPQWIMVFWAVTL
jgi:hypothetical protein